jgi:hypothetical protein
MKLIKLIDKMLDEATIHSAAADQAKKLGLKYAGYGKWKDESGQTVAQTIKGQLVKIDPNQQQAAPDMAANSGGGGGITPGQDGEYYNDATSSEPPSRQPASLDAVQATPPEPEPDSYTEPEEPEAEVVPEPEGQTAVDRLMNAANGDYMKVKKVLAKKIHGGDEKAKELFAKVEAHEAKQKAELRASLDAVAAKQAQDLANRKAKYAGKYPSPQI